MSTRSEFHLQQISPAALLGLQRPLEGHVDLGIVLEEVDKILEACAASQDLELPPCDLENPINPLSGEQKV